jgi:hypothetical protein
MKLEGAHSQVFTSCRLVVCYCFGVVVARRHAFPLLVNYRGEENRSGARRFWKGFPS